MYVSDCGFCVHFRAAAAADRARVVISPIIYCMHTYTYYMYNVLYCLFADSPIADSPIADSPSGLRILRADCGF